MLRQELVDIDAGVFKQLHEKMRTSAKNVTLYASSNDRALNLSKKINGYPRAGDATNGVIVLDGTDSVDASEVDTDFIGHSYYGDNSSVISDIRRLICRELKPLDRDLKPVGSPVKYWLVRAVHN